MIEVLRQFARAFRSFRRWHAGLSRMRIASSARGAPKRAAGRRGSGAVIDLSAARRLRCLSVPCANTRLAIAMLRAERRDSARPRQSGAVR